MALGAGFFLGLIWFSAIRMVLVKNTSLHYHANFAIFVDGQQLKLEGPSFYEEVATCGVDGENDPKRRVHLHNNEAEVVHVHDEAATWGQLLANLRYGLSDSSITLDDIVLVDNTDGKQLTFWLNGKLVDRISNQVISSKDVLLISYGSEDEAALAQQFASIPNTAAHVNEVADPGTCSGNQPLTFTERLRRALSVNNSK